MTKSLRKIYLLFALCSLLIALLISFITVRKILPYSLKMVEKKTFGSDAFGRFIFYDLDHNGFEERIEMIKEPLKQFYYIKIYQDYGRGLIDQFNFKNEIVLMNPAFFDVNNDGWDDLFVFSNNDDSLYLSIIDVQHTKFLQKERPILASSPQMRGKRWDLHSARSEFVQLEKNGPLRLLFVVNTGYARLPRCLCLYDLHEKKIINRFDYNFGAVSFAVTDLNRDGFKEIALGSTATNNFPPEVPLSDAFSWFIVLDHNFKLQKPPVKLGEKFSGISVYKLTSKGQDYLLLRKVNPLSWLMVIDSTFEIIAQKEYTNSITSIKLDREAPETKLIAGFNNGRIEELDAHLNLLNRKQLNSSGRYFVIKKQGNILGDKRIEFFCYDKDFIYLFNHKWQLLARQPLKNTTNILDAYFVSRPNMVFPDIYCAGKKMFIRLKISSVNLYGKMPLLFLIAWLVSFLFLITGYWGVEKIRQYVFAFFFLLRQSDNAIILLDYKGRIVSVNKKVNRFLQLDVPVRKGIFFEEGFKQRMEIITLIRKSMRQARQITEQFSYEDVINTFIGSVTITPIFSLFKFVFAYIIEIKDSTEQVLLERQRNWQRNVRKMVHDIKTPIAGVQLKLQMLYMKALEQNTELTNEFCDELEAAYSELKRIAHISKNFLKISDFEQLKIAEINLTNFIEQALAPFQMYNNELMKIEVNVHPEVPEKVYWDERQIELVLHILVENGIDAIKGKGEVIIEVRPSAEIKNVDQPWVEFRIKDNGCGIPEENKNKIFEPHFSTKKEGTGLGLSFAKHIVQQHRGKIKFFSTENFGSEFIIILPIKVEEERST